MGRKNRKSRDEEPEPGFSAVNPFGSLELDLPAGEPTPAADEAAPTDPLAGLRLHVFFERKGRSGKTVTLVEGFPADSEPAALERLARELRQALATGGTVREQSIELQGDVVSRATVYLQDRGHPVTG